VALVDSVSQFDSLLSADAKPFVAQHLRSLFDTPPHDCHPALTPFASLLGWCVVVVIIQFIIQWRVYYPMARPCCHQTCSNATRTCGCDCVFVAALDLALHL